MERYADKASGPGEFANVAIDPRLLSTWRPRPLIGLRRRFLRRMVPKRIAASAVEAL